MFTACIIIQSLIIRYHLGIDYSSSFPLLSAGLSWVFSRYTVLAFHSFLVTVVMRHQPSSLLLGMTQQQPPSKYLRLYSVFVTENKITCIIYYSPLNRSQLCAFSQCVRNIPITYITFGLQAVVLPLRHRAAFSNIWFTIIVLYDINPSFPCISKILNLFKHYSRHYSREIVEIEDRK